MPAPDPVALGLAEMTVDPAGPRSPSLNGRPLYLDSRSALPGSVCRWMVRLGLPGLVVMVLHDVPATVMLPRIQECRCRCS